MKTLDGERLFYENKVKIIESSEEVLKREIDTKFDENYTETDVRVSEEALEKVYEVLKKTRPNKNIFDGVNFI